MNVVIIGPSITRTKGGMATVINDMLENKSPDVKFRHIVSHVEGSAMEKISCNVKAIKTFLATKAIDVVHIHVASGASFYRKSVFVQLSRLRNLPVVMHVHGADFDTFYRQSAAVAQQYIRKTFSACSKVLVLSRYWQDFFLKNITDKNVEVLHNGVYTQVFAACYTMPANLFKFLFLGRLGQRKGVYDLLQAADALVNRQHQKDFMFYLAGDGEVEQVKQVVQEKGLQNNVQVLGWIGEKEKLEWLKKADTMVLPSYNEGLPMSILEAMAAGKIIISGRVGGIPDLVTDGENGFLITPGDVESLQKHLLFVATHPEQMMRMAENNRRKIDEQYNLEKLNAWLFSMYRQLAKKSNV
jgi:glycosyltransferase involved in cell wall biosynthesis